MTLFNTYLERSSDVFDTSEPVEEVEEMNQTSDASIFDEIKNQLQDAGVEVLSIKDDIIFIDNGYMIQVNGENDYALSKQDGDKIDFNIVSTIDELIQEVADVKTEEESFKENFVSDRSALVNIILEANVNENEKAKEMFKMLRKQGIKSFAKAQSLLNAFGVSDTIKGLVKDCYNIKSKGN